MRNREQAQKWLNWYFSLPTIKRPIGIFDSYGCGFVQKINFMDECTVVWVTYKTKTKAFSYK